MGPLAAVICCAFERIIKRLESPQQTETLLGAFAKLRKATISLVLPVRLSIDTSAWETRLPLEKFNETWYFRIFRKCVQKIHFSLKYYEKSEDQYTFFYHASLISSLHWNISDKLVENFETHILGSIIFFSKILLLWDNVEKKTSSVYDCTVEDVEYICNSNSTLCLFFFFCN